MLSMLLMYGIFSNEELTDRIAIIKETFQVTALNKSGL